MPRPPVYFLLSPFLLSLFLLSPPDEPQSIAGQIAPTKETEIRRLLPFFSRGSIASGERLIRKPTHHRTLIVYFADSIHAIHWRRVFADDLPFPIF